MLWEGSGHRSDLRRARLRRAVLRKGDRAAEDLRAAGRARHRERASVQRDKGGARAADRHRGDPAGDFRIAHRCPAGAGRDRRARGAPLRRFGGVDVPHRGERAAASRLEGAVPGSGDTHGHAAHQPRIDHGPGPARRTDHSGARHARGRGRIPCKLRNCPAYRPSFGGRDAPVPRRPPFRRDLAPPAGGPAIYRARDRAVAHLRRPGGDRSRKRAPVQRNEGGARPAARVGRSSCRNQQLDRRHEAGLRQDPRKLRAPVRRANGRHQSRRRGRADPARRVPWIRPGGVGEGLARAR